MKTILIIDDDLTFQLVLADWLTSKNFEVIIAEGGSAGVQLALQHQPDLILCDINMPEVNGFDVLKQLRSSEATHIPFFFLTSETRLDLHHLQRLGATGLIQKSNPLTGLRQVLFSEASTDDIADTIANPIDAAD